MLQRATIASASPSRSLCSSEEFIPISNLLILKNPRARVTFAKAARYKKRDTLANIQWRPSIALLAHNGSSTTMDGELPWRAALANVLIKRSQGSSAMLQRATVASASPPCSLYPSEQSIPIFNLLILKNPWAGVTFAKAARYKMRDTLANIQWRPSSALLGHNGTFTLHNNGWRAPVACSFSKRSHGMARRQ